MQFSKICGCIIEYRTKPGYENLTAAPSEEVVVVHCKEHTPVKLGILK
jgi:hypothetical protein